MSALTSATGPSTYVTEIPGRFCPIYLVDKRNPGSISTSTTTSGQLFFLPRTETVDSSFQTPTNYVDELGTNYHVGEYDDLPEHKISLTCYDGSSTPLGLISQTSVPGSSSVTVGFSQLSTSRTDMVRQFADPAGNVFASAYQGDLCVEEFGFSLKAKSVAQESYSLAGFNMLKFQGFIQTKAYAQTGAPSALGSPDAGHYGFSVTALLGTNEGVVPVPAPSGANPASYWIQNGCLNFLKVERYRSGIGWIRFPEVATYGALSAGYCYYDGTSGNLEVTQSDIVSGDVFLVTYCTYATNLLVNGGNSYATIYNNTPDTGDPIAIPTRLTPFTIAGYTVPRGQSLDVKLSLKRERAEGIGDVTGIWGPPSAPEVSVSLEVKTTDFSLNSLLETGSPLGTQDGGTVKGDFYDPNYVTRYALATAVPLVATLYDPRDVSLVAKTYSLPTVVLNNENTTASTKNAITTKYSGTDRTGNLTVTLYNPD